MSDYKQRMIREHRELQASQPSRKAAKPIKRGWPSMTGR